MLPLAVSPKPCPLGNTPRRRHCFGLRAYCLTTIREGKSSSFSGNSSATADVLLKHSYQGVFEQMLNASIITGKMKVLSLVVILSSLVVILSSLVVILSSLDVVLTLPRSRRPFPSALTTLSLGTTNTFARSKTFPRSE